MNFRDDSSRPKVLSMFSHSSLTDIVMLLLIFFLLTSSFVTNFGIQVEIPNSEAGAPPESRIVEVAITKDGKFYVMGRETRDTQTMRDRIREEHTKSPTATLVVRADKEADIQKLVDVLTMGQSLQMKSLIATEQE